MSKQLLDSGIKDLEAALKKTDKELTALEKESTGKGSKSGLPDDKQIDAN